MPSLGPAEILVILVIALLVFGPNKMPEIARQVGKGFREFRRVQQHLRSELRDVVSEFDSPSTTPPSRRRPGPDAAAEGRPSRPPPPQPAPEADPGRRTEPRPRPRPPTELRGPRHRLPSPARPAEPA